MRALLVSSILLLCWSSSALHAADKHAEGGDERPHTFLVGFAQDTLENDWRSAQARELREAFESHPEVRFILTNAQGRTAQQIIDMEDLVSRGVDLLITSPRDGRAMAPAVQAIYRSGVPVVLLTRRVPGESFTSFIAPDDAEIAARAADLLATRLGKKGRVLVLQGVPTATTAIHRTRGFQQALQRYPGMSIVAMRTANYLRADALHETESVLADGIAFDAIFAQSDSMAAGARMALQAAGIDPKSIPIVGIDYIAEAREAIRTGEQYASFTYPTCGREGVEQAIRILKGQPFERRVTVESTLVTRDNVEQVEPVF